MCTVQCICTNLLGKHCVSIFRVSAKSDCRDNSQKSTALYQNWVRPAWSKHLNLVVMQIGLWGGGSHLGLATFLQVKHGFFGFTRHLFGKLI